MRLGDYLPGRIAENYLNKYEQEELDINNVEQLHVEKDELLSKRWIGMSEINDLIKKHSIYPYSNFAKIRKSHGSADIKQDIKFSSCLYLQIPCFTGEVYKTLDKAVKDTNCGYLILDLRKCVGGDFDDCVRSCNLFLSNCEIVSVQNKRCKASYYADENKKEFQKIFILVDENTMSSAEIMALSLASNSSNVQILGDKTYGKGVVIKNYYNRKYRCKLSVTAYNWKVNSKSVDSLTDYTKRCDDHGIWKHILNEIN